MGGNQVTAADNLGPCPRAKEETVTVERRIWPEAVRLDAGTQMKNEAAAATTTAAGHLHSRDAGAAPGLSA